MFLGPSSFGHPHLKFASRGVWWSRRPHLYCSPSLPRKQLLAAAVGGAVEVAVVVVFSSWLFVVRHPVPVDVVVVVVGEQG
jgi:hypothetical protein